MGNKSSFPVNLENFTNLMCCCHHKREYNVEKAEKENSRDKSTFYIESASPSATSQISSFSMATTATIQSENPSIGTTLSKSSPEIVEKKSSTQSWFNVELPQGYEPMNAPVNVSEVVDRFQGRAGLKIMHKQATLWTKTKDSLLGNCGAVAETKSDDIKADVKIDAASEIQPKKRYLETSL